MAVAAAAGMVASAGMPGFSSSLGLGRSILIRKTSFTRSLVVWTVFGVNSASDAIKPIVPSYDLSGNVSVRTGDLLTEADAAEIRLIDVGADPDVGDIGDRDDGSSGGNVFAGFDVLGKHDPVRGETSRVFVHLRLGERDGGAGLVGPGAALGDVFGARARLHELESLGGLDDAGFGDLELGLRRFELAVGDGVLAAQIPVGG